jgi:hypothetical protein
VARRLGRASGLLAFCFVDAMAVVSLHDDMYNKIVNNAIIPDESNIWHSRLCQVNFG